MKKLLAFLLAALMLMGVTTSLAEEWPNRAIELIVPANPGGDSYAHARALAEGLKEKLGWEVTVTDMPGGAGNVAFEYALNHPDDGYRFVFYHSGAAVSELLGIYGKYNILDDFKLAGMPVMDYTNAFVISGKNPNFSDLEGMVAYMKANPGKVSFGTEVGSFTHLHLMAFEEAAGVKFDVVDAGTASQKRVALTEESVDVIGIQSELVRKQLDSKEFICLGILADERVEALPDLPTLKEQGYDVQFAKFFYVAGANEVDDAIITKLNEGLKLAVESEIFLEYAKEAAATPNYMTPEETEEYFGQQYEAYKKFLGDMVVE